MDEVDDPTPAIHMLAAVHPSAARARCAPRSRDIRHLGNHQSSATHRAAAQVNQVPVIGQSVFGAVHGHGRDDDAVPQMQIAQLEGREHRRRQRRVVAFRRQTAALDKSAKGAIHDLRVTDLQRLVRDAARAGQQAECELVRRRSLRSAGRPRTEQALECGALEAVQFPFALQLVLRQRILDSRLARQVGRQRDGVLHRQLRPEPMLKWAVWAASPSSATLAVSVFQAPVGGCAASESSSTSTMLAVLKPRSSTRLPGRR